MDLSALSDHDLLRDYARDAAESAFAELVRRYLNLVYSSARRQTRSPELAQDVAQSVFIDLARSAQDFDPRTPLVAWLHLVTRRTAIDAIRRESRRQHRDHLAATDPIGMNPPSPPLPWSQLEPQLDEVLTELSPPERTAVLLRFFENKNFCEVGHALGTSEEAARKRVTRALDQLRTAFVRRGLTLTSATLAADLSAHAIELAPFSLNAAISSAAIASAATGTSVAVFKTTELVLMTTVQKSAWVAALALFAGAGLYEAIVLQRENSRLELLQAQASRLSKDLAQARADAANSGQQLTAIDAKIDARLASSAPPLSPADAASAEQMKTWLANLERMKAALKVRPEFAIPELSLVDEATWFDIAAQMPLDTDEGLRRALVQLRQRGENQLGIKIMAALGVFMKSGATVLPTTPAGLLPFFDPPIAPELLDRYEMLQTGPLSALAKKEASSALIGVKSPADPEYDTLWRTGATGFSLLSAMSENVAAAVRRFSAANPGQNVTHAAQLQPFLKWPVSPAALEKYLTSQPIAGSKPATPPSP